MDAQNYKKLSPKKLRFLKILKICEKKIINPRTSSVIVLNCTKRKSLQMVHNKRKPVLHISTLQQSFANCDYEL